MPRTTRFAAIAILLLVGLGATARATRMPRGVRRYVTEQAVLPRVQFRGDSARIDSLRSFRWHAADSAAEPAWRSATIDLREVRSVWYALSPFGSARGAAHAFLTFGFADSSWLAVSIEARRELGEEYSPLRGALRRYELMVVIGDELDLIGKRTRLQRDSVYLFPTTATPAQASALLRALLERAEGLARRPEYYNTVTSNCASNIAAAINAIAPHRARWNPALVLPGYSDRYAWKRGFLAADAAPELGRARFLIDARAPGDSPVDFSRAIHARPR